MRVRIDLDRAQVQWIMTQADAFISAAAKYLQSDEFVKLKPDQQQAFHDHLRVATVIRGKLPMWLS